MPEYTRTQIKMGLEAFAKAHPKLVATGVFGVHCATDTATFDATAEKLLGDFGIDIKSLPAEKENITAARYGDQMLPGSGTPIDPVAIMKDYNERAVARATQPKSDRK